MRRGSSYWIGAWRGALIRGCGRLHRDDRGAISVLVILTMWCFVALLAMVWNTAEQSFRREQIQTAADSAAHASAQWMTRTVNAIDAQNMIICQDASTEAVWRAAKGADAAITARLDGDIVAAERMKTSTNFGTIRGRILRQRAAIADEYELTRQALGALGGGTGANFANPQAARDYLASVQQAQGALTTFNNTTVQQLIALANSLPQTLTNEQVLDYIINFVRTSEQPILGQFQVRTRPATSQSVDVQMAAHESEVYSREMEMAGGLPGVIEQTRAQLADYYKVDLTLATLNGGVSAAGASATIAAPVKSAGDLSLQVPALHLDLIRMSYPQEALAANLLPVVFIDRISPHTRDNRIWHPNLLASADPGLRQQYPRLRPGYVVQCDQPGGWGHIWVAPLERYLYERIAADSSRLNGDYMAPLDQARSITLRDAIHVMLFGSPNGAVPSIPAIPASINVGGVNVRVLPRLDAPPAATSAYRTQVDQYNQHSAAYLQAVRTLRDLLQSYSGIYDRFTLAFASSEWTGQVDQARTTVASNLSDSRKFMVLQPYNLYYIPEWARAGVQASASAAIANRIIVRSMQQVTVDLIRDGVPDVAAAAIAYQIVAPTAQQAAELIAEEYVARPWPYEITPSMLPVPPVRGITREDRQQYFSVIAAARQTEATAPRLLASWLFNPDSTQLISYAQAETYNWMEFNSSYGGGDRFDQVTPFPWGEGQFVGAPRCWRVCTIGGWNWRSRLSLSDALGPALERNGELARCFQDAGVNTAAPEELDAINLH
jgi:hypothetical protein